MTEPVTETRDYNQTDGLSHGGNKVTVFELVIFAALCLYKFAPFNLPFSSITLLFLFASYSLWVRSLRWKNVGMEKPVSWWKTILRAVIAVTLIAPAFILLILPLATRLAGKPIDFSMFEALHGNLTVLMQSLAFTWITAAFAEEMVFRAYLMNRITDLVGRTYAGWASALVVSSVIFGSAHYYQGLTGMINASVIGFLIGALYLYSKRNLWSAILCHGLVDTVFFTIVYLSLDVKLFK